MTENSSRHRSHRRPNRLRQFVRQYAFEIVWVAIVGLGIFLIFERMNIRKSLFRWLSLVAQRLLRGAGQLGDTVVGWLAATTLSDAIGIALVLGALLVLFLRVRSRWLNNPALSTLRCPKCQGPIHRVHRTRLDHLINRIVPVQRYCCADRACRWQGLRIHSKHVVSRKPAPPAATN